MNLQPTLENDLVILRPLRESDFEALYEVAKDPLIWDNTQAETGISERSFQNSS